MKVTEYVAFATKVGTESIRPPAATLVNRPKVPEEKNWLLAKLILGIFIGIVVVSMSGTTVRVAGVIRAERGRVLAEALSLLSEEMYQTMSASTAPIFDLRRKSPLVKDVRLEAAVNIAFIPEILMYLACKSSHICCLYVAATAPARKVLTRNANAVP
jgi:hypothetical protein